MSRLINWAIVIVVFVHCSVLSATDFSGDKNENSNGPSEDIVELSPDQITKVSILPGFDSDIGPRKAGLICGPNGRFEMRDFVDSDEDLKLALIGAFLREGLGDSSRFIRSLVLEDLNVNLCARRFFPGKSGNYSGDASFSFLVEWVDGSQSFEAVSFHIERNDALNEGQILRTGLVEIAR